MLQEITRFPSTGESTFCVFAWFPALVCQQTTLIAGKYCCISASVVIVIPGAKMQRHSKITWKGRPTHTETQEVRFSEASSSLVHWIQTSLDVSNQTSQLFPLKSTCLMISKRYVGTVSIAAGCSRGLGWAGWVCSISLKVLNKKLLSLTGVSIECIVLTVLM